jgi:hypothetical protein
MAGFQVAAEGWKNESHFTSWLGLTPSREISGGKIVKQESRKIKSPVATMLRMAASSLIRSESYLAALGYTIVPQPASA